MAANYEGFLDRYPLSTVTEETYDAAVIHADELVRSVCLAAISATDEDAQTAIEKATYDQIAAWLETGDSNDLAGYAAGVSLTIGDFTIGGQPAAVSPRAVRTLRTAGLLQMYGA